jgi:hypothetical protein
MTWRLLLRIAYSVPILLAILLIPCCDFFARTRQVGIFPVRIDWYTLIVWRYGRQWIVVDLRPVAWLLVIDFLGVLAGIVVLTAKRLSRSRENGRHGFDVVPLNRQ